VAAIFLWGTIHYLFSKAAYARSIDGLARYNTTSRTWLADTSGTNRTASASGNSTDIAEHDDDELALSLTLVVYELFLCPYDERRTPFLWVFAIHYQAALSTLALLVFRSCAYVLFGVVVAWQREALAPDLLRKVFPITLLPPEPMVEVKESSNHFRVTMLVTYEDAAAASSSQVAPKLEKLRHKGRKLLAAHKCMLESDISKQAGRATSNENPSRLDKASPQSVSRLTSQDRTDEEDAIIHVQIGIHLELPSTLLKHSFVSQPHSSLNSKKMPKRQYSFQNLKKMRALTGDADAKATVILAENPREALVSYAAWMLMNFFHHTIGVLDESEVPTQHHSVIFLQAAWVTNGLTTVLLSDTLGMPEIIKELVFPKEMQQNGSRFHGTLVARSESLWSDLAYFVLHSAQVLARRWPRLLLSRSIVNCARVTVSSDVWLGRSELPGAVRELADGRVRH
jgi:hypothetical protein